MISRYSVTMALSATLVSATGRPVGRGRKPMDTLPPYYFLDSVGTDLSGAPFSDLNEDAALIYQLTSVSGPDPSDPNSFGIAEEAEWLADKARTAFLGRDPVTGLWLHDITVAGSKVIGRSLDTEPGAMNDPGDAIMSYVQRFRFDLTPA